MNSKPLIVIGIIIILFIVARFQPIIPVIVNTDSIVNSFPYRATWTQLYYKGDDITSPSGDYKENPKVLTGLSLRNSTFVGNQAVKGNGVVYVGFDNFLSGVDSDTFESLMVSLYGTESYNENITNTGDLVPLGVYYDKNNLYLGNKIIPLSGELPLEVYKKNIILN